MLESRKRFARNIKKILQQHESWASLGRGGGGVNTCSECKEHVGHVQQLWHHSISSSY